MRLECRAGDDAAAAANACATAPARMSVGRAGRRRLGHVAERLTIVAQVPRPSAPPPKVACDASLYGTSFPTC